ncbi:MAG: ComF family protein [Aeromicrobium sp.]|nr:MAG: ComF family protein [Aeromicrobium sp.]
MTLWQSGVLDLLLGVHCAGCEQPGERWCAECDQTVRPDPVEVDSEVWAAGLWRGRLRKAILAWKLDGVESLDQVLGLHLACAIIASGPPESFVIVPIPTTWRSRRERGRHAVLDVAKVAAETLSMDGYRTSVEPAISLRRQTRDQAFLTARMRAANVRGSMVAKRPPIGPVIIVDDIVTTGSTLAEARRALEIAGAWVHASATIASSPR